MKIILSFPASVEEAAFEEMTAFLQEQNLPGMIIERPEAEAPDGSMGIGDYLPLIQFLAGSTVAAATVKGLFDVIKKAMDLRQARGKDEVERGKIDFTIEKPDGTKLSLTFNALNEEERQHFSDFVDRAWQK